MPISFGPHIADDIMLSKPRRLRPNATIALVAPASPIRDRAKLDRGVQYLESLGYHCIVGDSIEKSDGYLAGPDALRANELNSFFAAKDVDAIFCVRGGYGTMRLLELLDWNTIQRNPKIFVGFSDITALQWALLAKARLPTLSGLLVGIDFDQPKPESETLFWSLLNEPCPRIPLWQGSCDNILNSGVCEGPLFAGTLSLATALCGTPFIPPIDGAILVFEDIGEEPYRIDRMLCQLSLAGWFRDCNGIIFGTFTECSSSSSTPPRPLEVIYREHTNLSEKPILIDVPYGHIPGKISLPIGPRARLDADKIQLILLEPFVQ